MALIKKKIIAKKNEELKEQVAENTTATKSLGRESEVIKEEFLQSIKKKVR